MEAPEEHPDWNLDRLANGSRIWGKEHKTVVPMTSSGRVSCFVDARSSRARLFRNVSFANSWPRVLRLAQAHSCVSAVRRLLQCDIKSDKLCGDCPPDHVGKPELEPQVAASGQIKIRIRTVPHNAGAPTVHALSVGMRQVTTANVSRNNIETLGKNECASSEQQCHPRTSPPLCHYKWACVTTASLQGLCSSS